jgi:N-acetylmuramoyl-L-alanine amidase
MQKPKRSNLPSKRLTRREFLLLSGIIGGGAAATCICGTSIATALLIRQARERANTTTTATNAPSVATPETTYPNMIRRETWGALEPGHSARNERGFYSEDNPDGWRVYEGDLAAVYNTVVIHHSAIYESDDNSTMLEIQRAHRLTRGWADVGYHYVVGKQGAVYEGRDIHVRGVHVEGYNTGTIGVCLMGNFMEEQPTQSQVNRARDLIQWLADRFALTHLAVHRSFNPSTECPGTNLITYTSAFALNAGLEVGTDGYVGPEASTAQCPFCIGQQSV